MAQLELESRAGRADLLTTRSAMRSLGDQRQQPARAPPPAPPAPPALPAPPRGGGPRPPRGGRHPPPPGGATAFRGRAPPNPCPGGPACAGGPASTPAKPQTARLAGVAAPRQWASPVATATSLASPSPMHWPDPVMRKMWVDCFALQSKDGAANARRAPKRTHRGGILRGPGGLGRLVRRGDDDVADSDDSYDSDDDDVSRSGVCPGVRPRMASPAPSEASSLGLGLRSPDVARQPRSADTPTSCTEATAARAYTARPRSLSAALPFPASDQAPPHGRSAAAALPSALRCAPAGRLLTTASAARARVRVVPLTVTRPCGRAEAAPSQPPPRQPGAARHTGSVPVGTDSARAPRITGRGANHVALPPLLTSEARLPDTGCHEPGPGADDGVPPLGPGSNDLGLDSLGFGVRAAAESPLPVPDLDGLHAIPSPPQRAFLAPARLPADTAFGTPGGFGGHRTSPLRLPFSPSYNIEPDFPPAAAVVRVKVASGKVRSPPHVTVRHIFGSASSSGMQRGHQQDSASWGVWHKAAPGQPAPAEREVR